MPGAEQPRRGRTPRQSEQAHISQVACNENTTHITPSEEPQTKASRSATQPEAKEKHIPRERVRESLVTCEESAAKAHVVA